MRWYLALPPLLLTVALGCTGFISDSGGDHAGIAPGADPGQAADLARCDGPSLTPSSRLPRLSHAQLANTVRDLLRLDAAPVETQRFIADVGDSGFDNNGDKLVVTPGLGRDYQRLAERLSAEIAADPEAVARLSPCSPSEDGCDAEFIAAFGRRAYRRPLSETEHESLLALFRAGAELVGGGDAFADGVQLTVEALLQSPNFVYRVERSTDPGAGPGEVALGSWEVATRLSYALWGTMPDDVLFDAAAADALRDADQVRAQADRMLSHPNATAMLDDFHRQLLSLEYGDITRDPALNPAWDDALAADLTRETQLFLQHVVLEEQGTLDSLFTANYTFVNDQTAAIYGDDILSDPGGEGFRRVELDPARRAGVLTQLGFLAGNAYFAETDPIHRGVHLHRKILCSTLPDPPDDIETDLPEPTAELRTTRERVVAATSGDTCQGCHRLINEPGFAFEAYDPIGQYRTHEGDVAVDTSGALLVDGESVHFDDAVGLSAVIGDSRAASECYTRHLFRYAHAREETDGDCNTLASLSRQVRAGDLTVRQLLIELVVDHSFLNRKDAP